MFAMKTLVLMCSETPFKVTRFKFYASNDEDHLFLFLCFVSKDKSQMFLGFLSAPLQAEHPLQMMFSKLISYANCYTYMQMIESTIKEQGLRNFTVI